MPQNGDGTVSKQVEARYFQQNRIERASACLLSLHVKIQYPILDEANKQYTLEIYMELRLQLISTASGKIVAWKKA